MDHRLNWDHNLGRDMQSGISLWITLINHYWCAQFQWLELNPSTTWLDNAHLLVVWLTEFCTNWPEPRFLNSMFRSFETLNGLRKWLPGFTTNSTQHQPMNRLPPIGQWTFQTNLPGLALWVRNIYTEPATPRNSVYCRWHWQNNDSVMTWEYICTLAALLQQSS